MAFKRKNNVNSKGRNESKKFIMLEHRLLDSPTFRGLSLAARCLLTELFRLYSGHNNGAIFLSVRDATARLGLSDNKVATKAFQDLIDAKLLEVTADSSFNMKAGTAARPSRARCYRLTFLSGPGQRPPSFDYGLEPAPKTPARKRMEKGQRAIKKLRKQKEAAGRRHSKTAVEESSTLRPVLPDYAPFSVEESSTLN